MPPEAQPMSIDLATRPNPVSAPATPVPASSIVAADAPGLPTLVGSASEIAAAMVIRARALRRLRLDLAERIRDQASARWWIDHRHQVVG